MSGERPTLSDKTFSVFLTSVGDNSEDVIAALHDTTDMSAGSAKAVVTSFGGTVTVLTHATQAQAEDCQRALRAAGATVEVEVEVE